VIAVQKPRGVEVGPHVLDHDVRRVAPAAHGDVAIGQREPLERGRVGAPDDLEARADRMREIVGRDGVHPLEIRADLPRQPLLPLLGAIE
jgi:hypothetical protein